MNDCRWLTVLQKSGCVMKGLTVRRLIPIDEANHKRHFSNQCMDFRQGGEIAVHKLTCKDQIQRRVTRDREFGRYNQICPLVGELAVSMEDFGKIPFKIPDRRIDLRKADSHRFHLTRNPTGVWHKYIPQAPDWLSHGQARRRRGS